MLNSRPMSAPPLSRSAALRRPIPAVGLLILSTCLLASWQQSTLPAAQPGASDTNAPVRALWVTALNQDGKPGELSASDLEVKIDGKPVSVSDVRRARPALRYCILLDTSGSTRFTLPVARDHITALLSKMPLAGRDYGLLVAFAEHAYVDAESADPQQLIANLHQETSQGPTALYDAVVACAGDLSKQDLSKNTPDVLPLIFIFSDGEDDASHVSLDAAERAVMSAGIRVYAIGEKDTAAPRLSTATKGIENLKRLSEVSGGRSYSPGKKMDAQQIVANISGDLSAIYEVTLASNRTLPAGRLYKLEVKSDKKGIALTAPRQYFVPSS